MCSGLGKKFRGSRSFRASGFWSLDLRVQGSELRVAAKTINIRSGSPRGLMRLVV